MVDYDPTRACFDYKVNDAPGGLAAVHTIGERHFHKDFCGLEPLLKFGCECVAHPQGIRTVDELCYPVSAQETFGHGSTIITCWMQQLKREKRMKTISQRGLGTLSPDRNADPKRGHFTAGCIRDGGLRVG